MSFGPELVWIWSIYLGRFVSRRVQKVDGGDNWISLSLSGGIVLLLSWGAQNCGIACITEKEKKALLSGAKQTPPITNALKSNLSGAELTEVRQLHRDRMIRLTFTKTLGAGFCLIRHLTLETMERYSNLIIIDDDGIILETAKHIHPSENRFRSTLPGQPYALPPEFKGISLEDWLDAPAPGTLKQIAGFGKTYLKTIADMETGQAEVCLKRFYSDVPPYDMLPQMIGKYMTASPLLLDSAVPLKDTNIEDTGRIVTLSPISNTSIGSRKKKILDRIDHEITRREHQIEDINRLLHEEDAEKYRHYGEILVSNAWQIKAGTSETEISYWDKDGTQKQETIPLNPAIMPAKNAAAYFAKYKKIISAQERAGHLLEKVTLELDDLKEQRTMISCADDAETLTLMEEEMGLNKKSEQKRGRKKPEAPQPPHKRFDLGFALVYAGISAKGNRHVTFHLATSEDMWFHAQGIPGSHVILRYNSVPTEEERLTAVKFCSSLAAHFSKGRNNPGQRVDYTQRKYVSPIRGGEANVTYREFQSITADPGFWQEFAGAEI